MSENHDIDGYIEEREINSVPPAEMDSEANEYSKFEDETLQITDVHAFEHTVGEYPVQEVTELSCFTNRTSNDSPMSVSKFLYETPETDTIHSGEIDLQTELAAVGLNSLYPSAGHSLDSSFETSFEKITSQKCDIKVTEGTKFNDHPPDPSIKINIELLDTMCDKKTKLNDFNMSFTGENSITSVCDSKSNTDIISTEINELRTSLKTAVDTDLNQLKHNGDSLHNSAMEFSNNCRDSTSTQFLHSTMHNQSSKDADVCNNPNTSQDNSGDEFKTITSQVFSIAVENDFEAIADMTSSVQNKSDNSELLNDETDSEFLYAEDSLITNNETLFSEMDQFNHMTPANNNHNPIKQPDTFQEMERLESLQEESNQAKLHVADVVEEIRPKDCFLEVVQFKEICQNQQYTSENMEVQMFALEESSFKDNIDIKSGHTQVSSPEKNEEDVYASGESILNDNDIKEITSKEVLEYSCGMENSISKNKGNQFLVPEKSVLDINVVKQINEIEESRSEEDLEPCNFVKEHKCGEIDISLPTEDSFSNNNVKEVSETKLTAFKSVVEETYAAGISMPKETNQSQILNVEDVMEESQSVKMFASNNDIKAYDAHQTNQLEIDTEHLIKDIIFHDNFAKETIHKTVVQEVVQEYMSEKYVVGEMCTSKNNTSDDYEKEIDEMACYISEYYVFRESHQVIQSNLEENKVDLRMVENNTLENLVTKGAVQVKLTSSEEVLDELCERDKSKCENSIDQGIIYEESRMVKGVEENNTLENLVANGTVQVELTSSGEVLDELCEKDESKCESNIDQGIVYEETQMLKGVEENNTLENLVGNGTVQVELTSSGEVLDELCERDESKCESNIDQGIVYEETQMVKGVEEKHFVKESVLENVDIIEAQKLQQLITVTDIDKTIAINGSKSENDCATTTTLPNVSTFDNKENTLENYAPDQGDGMQKLSSEVAYETLVEFKKGITQLGVHVNEDSALEHSVQETAQIQILSPKQVEEGAHSITESEPETDVTTETCLLQTSKGNVTETHLVQNSYSDDMIKQTYAIEECSSEEYLMEMNQLQQSNSEEIQEEIVGKEKSLLEEYGKDIQPDSKEMSEDLNTSKVYLMKNNIVKINTPEQLLSPAHIREGTHFVSKSHSKIAFKEKCEVQQSISEDTVAKTNLMQNLNDLSVIEETFAKEECKNEISSVADTNHLIKLSPVEFVEESLCINKSLSENYVMKMSQRQQSVAEEVQDNTMISPLFKNEEQLISHVQDEGGTHFINESLSKSYITENCQGVHSVLGNSKQKTHAIKQSVLKTDVEVPFHIQQKSDGVLEETLAMEKSLNENITVKETLKIKQLVSEDGFTTKSSIFENSDFKESPKMQSISPNHVREIMHSTNLSKCSKVLEEQPISEKCAHNNSRKDVSEYNSSDAKEHGKIERDHVSESSFHSFYCQQDTDMSLTIVAEAANNMNTSELSDISISNENGCDSPITQTPETLSDLLYNADIEDTNDFTSHYDQKMHDALYVPSCNDMTENGLLSFMEITMANTHEAIVEQTLNNTKQPELSHGQGMNKIKGRAKNSLVSEYPSHNQEEIISCTINSSNSKTDFGNISNKNHEVMQQSMSDYVTNLSLNLAIPDSYAISDINYDDQETRQKCEEQTENVLLMKWPAQYHDDIKLLKQQNHLLSQSTEEKDTLINKLKLENEDLLCKLSDFIARSKDTNLENLALKNMLEKSNENGGLIILLQQENAKLLKDLEALKIVESEFFIFKEKNKELMHDSEKNRASKEREIQDLKDQIARFEQEILNIGQTVIDIKSSNSQEVCALMEIINSKNEQIETLTKDKSSLEEKISYLNTYSESFEDLKQENYKLIDALQVEKEKSETMEKLKVMLEKQNRDMNEQNEKIENLIMNLNEKEQQIQDLIIGKVNLEETVASLNKHLEELNQLEDENARLKCSLQEENNKQEEITLLCKSLQEQASSQLENISKINNDISEKDSQIITLTKSNEDLSKVIETLNLQLVELNGFEDENEKLKFSLNQKDEEIKEIKSCKTLLEEQLSNLKTQNELLWDQLKLSSTKEQSLYALKEESILLEEKLSQMKREMLEINNLKSENEHLVDEITNKDIEIRNLTADKKKLKSSLIKASDTLNERDAEIEKLSEQLELLDERLDIVSDEKAEMLESLKKLTEQETLRKEELNNERLALSENISNVSEYLSSLTLEKNYLAEEIILHESKNKEVTEELIYLKKKIVEEKKSFDCLQSEKEYLLNSVDNLKETIKLLTEELNEYKQQCKDIQFLKEENAVLILKVDSLSESVTSHENEKTLIQSDISSLSETVYNLLIDSQLLSEELRCGSEIREHLALLTSEKHQLEELIVNHEFDNASLHKSILTLQGQLEDAKDKDKVIDKLKDLSKSLEDHLTSLNEELMNEISENQYLSVINKDLERKFNQNNEEILELKNRISSLTQELGISREENCDLQELVTDLENHMSSLNEELMSEAAKSDFLFYENEHLGHVVSLAVDTVKNRIKDSDNLNDEQVSLQTYIDNILLEINNVECENMKLHSDIKEFQATLNTNNKTISDLLNDKQILRIELETTVEQKIELENKLTMALSKEADIRMLNEENEILSKIVETHKNCEDVKKLLQNQVSNLEAQTQSLTETVEVLRNDWHQSDTDLKEENLLLKEEMSKEIYSLTGEVWDSKGEPLIEVYKKLMSEFLNKEKEVIFALQNDFECKINKTHDEIVSLKRELNEKVVFTSKLENEVHECKTQLNNRDTLISSLETELLTVKNEINSLSCNIEEINQQAEKEKDKWLAELSKIHTSETKLEEKVSLLNNEVNCKMDIIDELTLKSNEKQELISQLNLQLTDKTNKVSQLTECLAIREKDIERYLMEIEEIKPAVKKLSEIETEFELMKHVTSLHEEFDVESLIGTLKICQVFGDVIKLLVSRFDRNINQLQTCNENLKLELSNQIEVCKSLETQINNINEELKSCKLLYDEDSLQFKEEIAAKNVVIANLSEALEQFKQGPCLDADVKTDSTEMERMKKKLSELEEENKQLQNESNKITYLTEVNRKLSWEIEELSRSIKFEKQSNIELKTKCDLATNQVADLSKKNFHLEDKVEVLERKLENHDVTSLLKIGFPLGINTVDKKVQYLNEKLAEYEHISSKFSNLDDEYTSLKHEYEKSKDIIKKQEEKISKIMKRELELKKQIASNLQTSPDIKVLKEWKTEIMSLFPDECFSLAEAVLKIKSLVNKEKKITLENEMEIEDLKKKVEELSQENKDLDVECEMMNKHIEEQKDLLAAVFKREEELIKLNAELESRLLNNQQIIVDPHAIENNLKELFELFPEKPASLKDSINLVKCIVNENQTLKEKISESQEEYASLDKECEDMFKAYKEKENDLADVLKREASTVAILKSKQEELENKLISLAEELEVAKTQQESPMSVPASCQCEELKSRLSELKSTLAERNAKITALEMEFEADNFPLKKKVADLEKSLDQAKHKINELKCEVRRYQEQMCDVTVGLRAECERCRSLGTAVDPNTVTTLQQQIQDKNKEIQILKGLCKSRNQRIKELEEHDGSYKLPRQQRSALKEVKENKAVPPSPTKPIKGGR